MRVYDTLHFTFFCLRKVYPSEKFSIRSFNANTNYSVQQIITERGICVTINAPLSKFLSKRYFNAHPNNWQVRSIVRYIMFLFSRQEKLKQEDIDEPMTCDFQQISQCFVRVEIYSVATVSCSKLFFKRLWFVRYDMPIRLNSIHRKMCRSMMRRL